MTRITIYDDDEKTIDEISERLDVTNAEVIRALLEILETEKINIEEYI